MRRVCEPLWQGDPGPHCGRVYDDATRWTICPHRPLDETYVSGLANPQQKGAPMSPNQPSRVGAAIGWLIAALATTIAASLAIWILVAIWRAIL